MNQKVPPTPPDYNQYGLKDDSAHAADVYSNRPGGETPGVGPMDHVDASGHRLGVTEDRPAPKPSSRSGQAAIGEIDTKKR